MPTAQGWAPLLAKYQQLNYKAINAQKYIDTLMGLHRNSCTASNTAIWIFEGPAAELTAISANADALLNKASVFAPAFPKPVDQQTLLASPLNGEFVRHLTMDDGTIVIYACAKRAFRHREAIEVDQLTASAQSDLSEYEEVFGIRSGYTQAYDRVVIDPSANTLELHIDLCCPLGADDLVQAQIYYTNKLKALLQHVAKSKLTWLNQGLNFFPKIDELYQAKDGQIIALGHATSTKSIKEERMRSRKQDLRKETFHKEGINAIPSTDHYSIKKGWDVLGATHVPSVFIPGGSALAGAVGSAVRHAIIENCATPEDFRFVVNKIL